MPAGLWIAVILAVALLFSALTIWVRADGERRARQAGPRKSRTWSRRSRHTKGMELTQTGAPHGDRSHYGDTKLSQLAAACAAWPLTPERATLCHALS